MLFLTGKAISAFFLYSQAYWFSRNGTWTETAQLQFPPIVTPCIKGVAMCQAHRCRNSSCCSRLQRIVSESTSAHSSQLQPHTEQHQSRKPFYNAIIKSQQHSTLETTVPCKHYVMASVGQIRDASPLAIHHNMLMKEYK